MASQSNFLHLIFHSMLSDEESQRATGQRMQFLFADKRERPNPRSDSKNVHLNPRNKSPLITIFKRKVTNTAYVAKMTKIFNAEISRYFNFVAITSKYTFKDTYIFTNFTSKHFGTLKKCLRHLNLLLLSKIIFPR